MDCKKNKEGDSSSLFNTEEWGRTWWRKSTDALQSCKRMTEEARQEQLEEEKKQEEEEDRVRDVPYHPPVKSPQRKAAMFKKNRQCDRARNKIPLYHAIIVVFGWTLNFFTTDNKLEYAFVNNTCDDGQCIGQHFDGTTMVGHTTCLHIQILSPLP